MKFYKMALWRVLDLYENVKHIGEIITISAMKKVMPFCNNRLDKLYTGLIHDIFDYKPYNEPYSDGYDLAQTAILFLCEHMGERLDATHKTISIKQDCYRAVYRAIQVIRRRTLP